MEEHLTKNIVVVDMRSQPEYNRGHIPGACYVSPESVRGVVHGVSSMLMPADSLGLFMGHIRLHEDTMVVVVPGDKAQDGTLFCLALVYTASRYPTRTRDRFTDGWQEVLELSQGGKGVLVDVRPREYYME